MGMTAKAGMQEHNVEWKYESHGAPRFIYKIALECSNLHSFVQKLAIVAMK